MDRDYDTWSNDMAQCGEVNDKNYQCGLAPQHPGVCQFVEPLKQNPVQCDASLDMEGDESYRCSDDLGHDGPHHHAESGNVWDQMTGVIWKRGTTDVTRAATHRGRKGRLHQNRAR